MNFETKMFKDEFTLMRGTLFDKFNALLSKHKRVKGLFHNYDTAQKDRTAAGWDAEIAFYAAMEHWSDQEIADLLVAHHKNHGHRLEAVSYYERVVTEARNRAKDTIPGYSRAERRLAQMEEIERLFNEGDPRLQVSRKIGMPILGVRKYVQNPPVFALVTPDKEVEIGNVTHLIKQDKLRGRIATHFGYYIPQIGQEHWSWVVQLMLDICEEVQPKKNGPGGLPHPGR